MLLECLGEKAVDNFNEDGSEQAAPGEAGGGHAVETRTLMLPGAGGLHPAPAPGSDLGWRWLVAGHPQAHLTGLAVQAHVRELVN